MKPRVKPLNLRFLDRYRVTDERGEYIIDTGWRRRGRHIYVPDWRDALRVGSVITNGASMRIVRDALYRADGILQSVTCVIQNCSWTRRCYTVITRADLKSRGFRSLGVRAKVDTDFDKQLAVEIDRHDLPRLTCYDVRGIA